jgi:proteasome lid subunit RPN8/RPN11
VLGCFHSHPDGPATPSEPDRARAWPGLIYLIVGVPVTGFGPMRAFGLGEGGDPLPELVLRQESLPEDLRSGESPGKGP